MSGLGKYLETLRGSRRVIKIVCPVECSRKKWLMSPALKEGGPSKGGGVKLRGGKNLNRKKKCENPYLYVKKSFQAFQQNREEEPAEGS